MSGAIPLARLNADYEAARRRMKPAGCRSVEPLPQCIVEARRTSSIRSASTMTARPPSVREPRNRAAVRVQAEDLGGRRAVMDRTHPDDVAEPSQAITSRRTMPPAHTAGRTT
jgi:hypothetical protein